MSVNFTPSMGSIKDMKPFKFWCQKVLPTVYDDSLSYYELLCKVVDYLNDNVDNINLLNDNVTNLYNAYVALQEYVNNYFDQNFPELVSDKLDEMAEDGTLTALIKAYIDPYFEEKSDEIDEAISAQNENINTSLANQNSRINLLDTQMTQFIADHAGLITETTLWSGEGSGAGFLFNLSDDPTNYNYIDVHYRFTSMSTGTKQTYEGGVRRFNSQDFANSKCMITIPIANGNTSDIGVSTVLIKKHSVGENRYELDICDKVTTDVNGFQLEVVTSGSGGISANDPSCGGITKIVGVKNTQNDQEIINARIGADGTVYATLGDAIRAQGSDTQSQIDYALRKDNTLTNSYITGGYIKTNDGVGNPVSLTPVASLQRAYIVIPCNAGDKFTLTGTGANGPRLWAFTDEDLTLLSVANTDVTEVNTLHTAVQKGYFISNVAIANTYALSANLLFKAFNENDVDNALTLKVGDVNLNAKRCNLFDNSNITEGKYLQIDTGNLSTNADCFVSDYIDVSDLQRVSVYGTHLVIWCDSNRAWLSHPTNMNSRLNMITYDKPSNAKYIRFSTYNNYLNTAQVGENIDPNKYISYDKYTQKNLLIGDDQITRTGVIVALDGTGDYTSFTQAVRDNIDNNKTIYVKQGTYDIVQEYIDIFGEEAVNNMQDSDSQIFDGFQYGVKLDNRKLVFYPGSKLFCDWNGHTSDGTHRFSALRVGVNVEIEGLYLESVKTWYAIHDDYGSNSAPYTNKYKNCHVVGSYLRNNNCIGAGCKKYSRHILENCYFDNGIANSRTVRIHNTDVEGAEPEVYVNNCYFNSKFTPMYYGNQTTKMKVYVNNCRAETIEVLPETNTSTVNNVMLYSWNNSNQ